MLLVVVPAAAPAAGQSLDEARELYFAGRTAEAVAVFQAVAAGAEAGGDPETAGIARNNACVLLGGLGEHAAALPECRAAVRLRRADGEPRGLARSLNNLGLAQQNLGEYADSARRFSEALALNRELGDAEGQAVNLGNLGATATLAGRYGEAIDYHREAAALAAAHAGKPWADAQRRLATLNEGVVLEHLGAFREALELYRRLLAEGDGAGDGTGEGTGDGMEPGHRAALEINAGVIYRNLGDPVTALGFFRRAAETYERLGDASGLANAFLNSALARQLNLDRPRAAEADFRRALELARGAGDRPQEIEALFYLGRLLFDRGRLDEAEEAFARCLAAAEAAGSAEGRWSAREGLGRVAEARGELRGALDHLLAAAGEIEQVRAGLAGGVLRGGFFGAQRPVYAAAVRVLAELHRREPAAGHDERALEVVERAKSRELLAALGPSGHPAAPLAAGELRRWAGDEPVLEYFAGEDELYLWVIRGDGIRLLELGAVQPASEAVARVHAALARRQPPPADDLAALWAALVAPAGELPTDGGRLRIAADGRLRYLPFEILAAPAGEPLVERATVSYLPSASALAVLSRRSPPARRESGESGGGRRPARVLAGFGAPELPPPGAGPVPLELLISRFALGPLPAAAGELAAAGRELPGEARLWLGPEATEAAFRRAVGDGARVLHLATHTVIDERPGRGAAVLFTPAGGDDGLLYPEEIAALPIAAELTVLASCSTTLGAADDGRALASLTGSFLAAGSRAVVATLWDVDDRATAAFMTQLYHQLGRGLPPAAALRQAKRRLRADPGWSDPALWSAYVLVGEAGPVVPRPTALWVWLSLAVLVGLAALVAVNRYRTR